MTTHYNSTAPSTMSYTRADLAFKAIAGSIGIGLVLLLALWNLTHFPAPWYDEGSHLHVPKTFVRHGVYADLSSEGYRYYGPTIGVGPTVLLPIAGVFKVFGIGLLQARLVIVIYLLATIAAFFSLARLLGNTKFASLATAIFVSSPSVALFEYGRQVLGEVPGLMFILLGLLLWFSSWHKLSWWRLVLAGVLLGLGVVTKYQYLLAIVPTLMLSWGLNLAYFRAVPHRVFLVLAITVIVVFGLWQLFTLIYLGPSTVTENFAALREFNAGAAAVFSRDLMVRALREIVSWRAFMFTLLPALGYGAYFTFRHLPDDADVSAIGDAMTRHQQWSVIFLLVTSNLVWYVVASVSWIRYAFIGLSLASLFVARLFYDLTNGLNIRALWNGIRACPGTRLRRWGQLALLGILVVMVIFPLGRITLNVMRTPLPDSFIMADYVNANVSHDALIETWEPEMGFLTDHRYHYPPQLLLIRAVRQIWQGGVPVSELYDFTALSPDYVLVGEFSRWVNVYPHERLQANYEPVTSIGRYELFKRR
ncbi:MAG: glycosyl transferase [Candidatus Roseilinea sp.]|nr:MAG: glycosyl transferase [Candidatus Roseilinea sp.]